MLYCISEQHTIMNPMHTKVMGIVTGLSVHMCVCACVCVCMCRVCGGMCVCLCVSQKKCCHYTYLDWEFYKIYDPGNGSPKLSHDTTI